MELETTPPFMENSNKNSHVVFWNTSLTLPFIFKMMKGQDVNIRKVWNVIVRIIKWSKQHIRPHLLAFEISLRLSRAGSPGRQGVWCQLKKRNFSISVKRTALDDEIEDRVHNFHPYPHNTMSPSKLKYLQKQKQNKHICIHFNHNYFKKPFA